MKTRYIALVALAIVLSACGKHDDGRKGDPVAAEFVCDIGGGVTARVSGEDGDMWDEGDRIGISGAGYTNIPFVNNGGKFREEGASVYFSDANTHTFNAYYPYNEAGGVLTVTTDTEAQRNQSSIDFLFATGAEGNTHNRKVKFTDEHSFRHCMSRICINFIAGDEEDFTVVKPTDYTLVGLVHKGTFDTATGMARTDGNAVAEDVTMRLDGSTVSRLIILPQEVTDYLGIVVSYYDKKYDAELPLPSAPVRNSFSAGYNYIYTVKLNKPKLEITTPFIEWTADSSNSASATL